MDKHLTPSTVRLYSLEVSEVARNALDCLSIIHGYELSSALFKVGFTQLFEI